MTGPATPRPDGAAASGGAAPGPGPELDYPVPANSAPRAIRIKPKSALIIGSGPVVIGQAAEFDYAGTQA